jgi:hypothetical protein
MSGALLFIPDDGRAERRRAHRRALHPRPRGRVGGTGRAVLPGPRLRKCPQFAQKEGIYGHARTPSGHVFRVDRKSGRRCTRRIL